MPTCRDCVFWCSFGEPEGYCDAVGAPEPLLRIELFVITPPETTWLPVEWKRGERPVLVTPADFYCSQHQPREAE